jgi:hypothetical protein
MNVRDATFDTGPLDVHPGREFIQKTWIGTSQSNRGRSFPCWMTPLRVIPIWYAATFWDEP